MQSSSYRLEVDNMLRAVIIDHDEEAVQFLQEHFSNIHVLKAYATKDFDTMELADLEPEVIFMNIDEPKCVNIKIIQYIANHHLTAHLVYIRENEDKDKKNVLQGQTIKYIEKPYTYEKIKRLEEEIKKDIVFPIYPETEVNMFKRFYFKKDGKEITNIKFRTAKTRELLIYLIQNGDEVVRKETLIQLLWPNVPMENAYDNLYAAIYYLRKVLRELNIGIHIHTNVQGYVVEYHNITCNMMHFEQLYNDISNDLENGRDKFLILKKFNVLKKIYIGDYLEDEPYKWKNNLQEKCRLQFLSIARKIIKCFVDHEKYMEAIIFTKELQMQYPKVDYTYLALMKLYQIVGELGCVTDQYEKLKKMLEEEFGSEPNKMIQDWYDNGLPIDGTLQGTS